MSRYLFTDDKGFSVATVEAPTAAQARAIAEGHAGASRAVHCTHLSDSHHPGPYVDPAFHYGPDYAN